MKFSKLVRILTEAKDTKPGQRYFNAQNSPGPSGIASSPVGKVRNFPTPQKLNKWEFDPSKDLDKKSPSGYSESSKMWKAMTYAFGLLANDTTFQTQVNEISKEFDKNRESYRNIMGLEEYDKNGKVKAYDEERKSNSLPKTIDSQESRLTGYESEIRKRRIIINHSKMPPGEKAKLERLIASMEAELKVMVKQQKGESRLRQSKYLADAIKEKEERIDKLKDTYSHTQLPKSTLHSMNWDITEYGKKISDLTKKLNANKEELDTLTTRTQNIEENNQENNDKALEQFKHLINSSARKLSMRLRNEDKNKQRYKSLEEVDWDNLPMNAKNKIGILDSLASSDPTINPIFGYIDRFAENYYNDVGDSGEKIHVKELDEREFNPQLNISKVRDYNGLPFVRLLNIYSSVLRNVKSSPIPLSSIDMERHDSAYAKIESELKGIKDNPDEWNNQIFKDSMRILINDLEIRENDKQDLYNDLNKPWTVNKRGLTKPLQFLSRIESYCKDIKTIQKESFDSYVENILLRSGYDEDDFKCDMMEILSR